MKDTLPRRLLLTGASGGIGRAIARRLIDAGVQLALVGRDRAALQTVVGHAQGHALIEADLARSDEAEASVERASELLGGLDGLVACAGIAEHAAVGAIGADALARQMQVNFMAPFMMAQRAAGPIAQAGGGAMLFIASTLGIKPAPLTSAYAASKAALISMTQSFALELGGRGIRVNAIAPGVVDTAMVRTPRLLPGVGQASSVEVAQRIEAQLEALRREHPLSRLGHPDEVAQTALYLLRATYITGAVITVDGGLLLGKGQP